MKHNKIICLGLACTLLLGIMQPSAQVLTKAVEESEEKIDKNLLEVMSVADESLSVAIWYKDFELEELEEKTEAKLGYSSYDLEEEYELPSTELADALAMASQNADANVDSKTIEYADNLLSSYLEATAEARKLEKEQTAAYLKTRREICTELHFETAKRITEKYKISSDNITFISHYAPLIICQMTAEDVYRVSQCEEVQNLSLMEDQKLFYEEISKSSPSDYISSYAANNESVGVTKALNKFSIDTSDAKIGIYGYGHIAQNSTELVSIDSNLVGLFDTDQVIPVCNHGSSVTSQLSSHDTWCASIAAGNYGVAPGATIYTADMSHDNIPSSFMDYESLIDLSDVVCWENVWVNTSTPVYSNRERYVDSTIRNTGVINIVPSGNQHNDPPNSHFYISCPGNAYNAITVAGYYVGNPDTLHPNSNYLSGSHCLKPDVIAPAKLKNTSGTSYSAAMIAGMIALLIQFKPSLAAKPEVVKAILMASCHRKVSESMTGGLTNREGAGIPNLYTMFNIVTQQTYGYGRLTDSNNYSQVRYFSQKKYNAEKTNLCMAYIHSGSTTDNLNVDMQLKKRNGTLVGSSSYAHSSVEMLYVNTSAADYRLQIYETSTAHETSNYGYAWSTNDTYEYDADNRNTVDAVCYLHNSGSNYYLTQNITNDALTQSAYTGSKNQQWILRKNPLTNKFIMVNAASKDAGIIMGDLISSGFYEAEITPVGSTPISRMNLWDGSDKIKYSNYALCILNSSTTDGASIAWKLFNNTDSTQNWFLEVVPYRKGDANSDGNLNTTDVQKIQTMITNIQNGITYTNLEMYLADYDNNGVVNASDVSKLSTYLSTIN